jgi:hypothetical protein
MSVRAFDFSWPHAPRDRFDRSTHMEDWQEWQIRADQIAADLGSEIDRLEADFFSAEDEEVNLRSFWPRFRDVKEKVRTAPAIRLEDKLGLERRLRPLGNRAYKAQQAAVSRSTERKDEILAQIAALRSRAESETSPRALRGMRREFDQIRESFDSGPALVSGDRQAVWEAWREANQFAWQKLQELWSQNETFLREIIADARQQLEKGNGGAVRQATSRFFDALKTHEAKQEAINGMKAEIDEIRREADGIEERRATERIPTPKMPSIPAAEAWRGDLQRNRESIARLREEVAAVESQLEATSSLLESAMIRGTLVDKKRKLSELERSNRTLEQKLAQAEESPLLSAG